MAVEVYLYPFMGLCLQHAWFQAMEFLCVLYPTKENGRSTDLGEP